MFSCERFRVIGLRGNQSTGAKSLMTFEDVFSAGKKRLVRHAPINLHSLDIQPEHRQHTCIGITIDLEDATYMEQCVTDAKLTVQEECSAAYVAGWLEMKCADDK